jgi:dCMP deaminase
MMKKVYETLVLYTDQTDCYCSLCEDCAVIIEGAGTVSAVVANKISGKPCQNCGKASSIKWEFRFLEMAELVSTWSKDPSTKCGCVIVRPDRTIATCGFNGFPKKALDLPSSYKDRETKLKRILHAEENALAFKREDLTGCTAYIHPSLPCMKCAGQLAQAGIMQVVARRCDDSFEKRWNLDETRVFLQEMGIRWNEF